MRPVRIDVQGFGAFREPTEIDFEGVDLFALVGPTGSGKSTIIDAICFALYGSVPRYGNKGSVAPIVTMGASEARVSLTFEVAGVRYVATRVVRRGKGASATTKEARLEAVGGDVLAGAVGEMDGAVDGLLGLTFEHFTRAVVLPQNEFARFLHDKPAARQDLLVKLLGFDVYERMMRTARARAAEHEATVQVARQRLEALADCTPDQLDVWGQWVRLYRALRHEVRAARDELRAVQEEEAAASAAAARERDIVDRLARAAVPAAVAKLAADRTKAAARLEQHEAAAGEAAAQVETAQAALAALGPRDGLLAARTASKKQELTGRPSSNTVQLPHAPTPQLSRTLQSLKRSRRTSSNVSASSTVTPSSRPLILRIISRFIRIDPWAALRRFSPQARAKLFPV